MSRYCRRMSSAVNYTFARHINILICHCRVVIEPSSEVDLILICFFSLDKGYRAETPVLVARNTRRSVGHDNIVRRRANDSMISAATKSMPRYPLLSVRDADGVVSFVIGWLSYQKRHWPKCAASGPNSFFITNSMKKELMQRRTKSTRSSIKQHASGRRGTCMHLAALVVCTY